MSRLFVRAAATLAIFEVGVFFGYLRGRTEAEWPEDPRVAERVQRYGGPNVEPLSLEDRRRLGRFQGFARPSFDVSNIALDDALFEAQNAGA